MQDGTRSFLEAEYVRMRDVGDYELIDGSLNCEAWRLSTLTSMVECASAAVALGLSDTTVEDDGRAEAYRWAPRGCYLEGSNNQHLRFNVNDGNSGHCGQNDRCVCARRSPQHALEHVVKILLAAADFHATNANVPLATPRPSSAPPASLGRPYKAIVVLFLNGGLDSWNLIVPHSGCAVGAGNGSTSYETYSQIRGGVALPLSSLQSISTLNQPCARFGVHPALSVLHTLYGAGEATFLANIGTLVEPITKTEYLKKQKRVPPSLFAHNTQVRVTQSVHAQNNVAKGVLGRLIDVVSSQEQPYSAAAYSVSGIAKILEGDSTQNVLDSRTGVVRFTERADLRSAIVNTTRAQSRSVFAETFGSLLENALNSSESLGNQLDAVTLTHAFPTDILASELEQTARVIKASAALGEERQAFFVSLGGFDTHSSELETVQDKLEEVNGALDAFVKEMKAQGVWDQVALLEASDFGRTLGSNGAGTDHVRCT